MLKLNQNKALMPAQDPTQRMESLKGKMRNAAKMYEQTFLREMVKSMRQTVPKGGLIKQNMAEGIFQEKLDHKYVDAWGKQGGVGLADLIYDQIMDRFGAQMGLKKTKIKPLGPIPFKEQSMKDLSVKEGPSGTSFQLKNLQSDEGQIEITSPWSGMLVKYDLLENGNWLAEVEHDSGLTSKLMFSGSKLLSKGQKVEAGDAIGLLSPGEEELLWQVNGNQRPDRQSVAKTVSI